jgi:hypothetical protein
MKRTLLIMLLLLGYVGADSSVVHAQQPLIGTPWYVMAYQLETDSLHWINADGEQASMSRPTLNDEAQYLDMRVSPNGETLVMTAQLNSGLQALGIYNLVAGERLRTQYRHRRSNGHQWWLGGRNDDQRSVSYGTIVPYHNRAMGIWETGCSLNASILHDAFRGNRHDI